jgi:hypothetical protein
MLAFPRRQWFRYAAAAAVIAAFSSAGAIGARSAEPFVPPAIGSSAPAGVVLAGWPGRYWDCGGFRRFRFRPFTSRRFAFRRFDRDDFRRFRFDRDASRFGFRGGWR